MNEPVFNDRWKIWIWSNVSRGCDKDGIFRILLDNGFEYADIARELGHAPSIDINLVPDPVDRARFFPNATRLESKRVEIYSLPGFLNPAECDHLIELIRDALHPSTIIDDAERDPTFRTSRTCDFARLLDPLAAEIDIRICRLLGINPTYSESMQGQYYEPGQEFKAHMDWFGANSEGLRYAGSDANQRTWTFMVYLNDAEEGGATIFDKIGVSVTPRRGEALFWNNLLRNGEPNPDVLHRAEKLGAGFKAIITKWFRSHGTGWPSIRQEGDLVPNYTKNGFHKLPTPEHLARKLADYFENNVNHRSDERQSLDYLSNPSRHPSAMIELPAELKQEACAALKPMLEKWAGTELSLSSVYGLRVYSRGTTLAFHRDRADTHIISAILNVAQQVDRDWPLNIEDNYYRTHKVFLQPGEMVLYESARLNHGRLEPLEGEYYCNLFVHFRPVSAALPGPDAHSP